MARWHLTFFHHPLALLKDEAHATFLQSEKSKMEKKKNTKQDAV
jgi:hypothetical protein